MDAVMLVEVLDVHGHVQIRQRVAGAGGQIRIGRSLACDVVLDDAYAAAEHTLLTLQSDGRVLVQDLATTNGTRIDGHRVDALEGRTVAKGELRIGRTRVLLRTLEADVPPERRFSRDPLQPHRTLFAAAGMLLCLAFAAFLQWTYAPERLAPRVLIAELVALCGLAVWVGVWALVSRLTVGAWQLRIHVAIAAFCVGLWVWGYWLYLLLAYVMQWRGLWLVMASLAAVVALAAAWLHLNYATHIRRTAALSLAVLAPLLCSGVWWLADLQLDPRTVNRVALGARVYPAMLRVAPSTDLGDYLTDAATLKRAANRLRQESLLETPIYDVDE
jgi:hypothetical protein